MQGNGNGISSATPACIDAETLAAWADGGLPRAEAALVEVHLADCDRCTAMVATFARTAPTVQAPESLWTRWHLRWLVPVATATTVAALWVLIPSQTPIGERAMMSVPAAEKEAPPATADSAPSQPASPGDTQKQEAKASSPRQAAPEAGLARRGEARRTPQQGVDPRQDANPRREAPPPRTESFAVGSPPPSERDSSESRTADTASEQFAPPIASAAPATAAAPAAPAPAAAAGMAPASPPPPPQTANTESARSRAAGALTAAPRAALSASILEISSPDPMTRWRVVGPGRVERSTDSGRRWEPATLPESATLTGGSSPSPSICWLIGRTGSIYVTTDGLRFTRVPFSERVDFVSIQAVDGRRATVVTIDGRTMRTDDQGATWIRINP